MTEKTTEYIDSLSIVELIVFRDEILELSDEISKVLTNSFNKKGSTFRKSLEAKYDMLAIKRELVTNKINDLISKL